MEIQKRKEQLPATGVEVLTALRKGWEKVRVTRNKYDVGGDGTVKIVETTIEAASPIRRLNAGVPTEAFYQYAELVKPEDKGRVLALIADGTFEVVKAIQAEQARDFAADKRQTPASWKQAAEMNTASLASLVKYKGEEKAVNLLVLLLKSFTLKFGKRNDLTAEGIKELAEDIVAQHPRLTIADVKFILRHALQKSVKFDKVFNLDYQTIMSLFDNGAIDKLNKAAEDAHDRHVSGRGAQEFRPINRLLSLGHTKTEGEVKALKQFFKKSNTK